MSSFKGGTLIAEDVHDLDAHQRRISDRDGTDPIGVPAESDGGPIGRGYGEGLDLGQGGSISRRQALPMPSSGSPITP